MPPNDRSAQRLDELARILNEQGADVYRVAAWRRAAMSLRRLSEPAHQGRLRDQRVVRGREDECADYYKVRPEHAA